MGRKAGRAGGQSGAKRGRDQIPRSAPPQTEAPPNRAPPAPACGSFTSKGSMFLFHGGLALAPPHSRSSCPLPSDVSPAGLCTRGFISVTPPLRPGSPARQGTAWVRKDLRRLKKWVEDGLALFPHAVSHSRQLAAGDM